MDERCRRFALLFRGSPRGHGTYMVQTGSAAAGTKLEGTRKTVHSPATDTHFEGHLAGTYGLGAVPLLLNPPGHTVWAAIDIDVYLDFDLPAFAKMVSARGLPLVVCRSKSGGAHNYVFFSEPVDTQLVRKRLKEWASVLGYPSAEVFPKQDRLSETEKVTCPACQGVKGVKICLRCEGSGEVESENCWGNWINLPYQAGSRSTRYALSGEGKALSLDQFLEKAEASKISSSTLEEFELFESLDQADNGDDEEAPPCILRMMSSKVVAGGRDQALFAAALYYKRAYPDSCAEKVENFNLKFLVPPLGQEDVRKIVRSALKKDYNYRCREHPLAGLCDRETCEERKFGVLFGRSKLAGTLALDLGPLLKIQTQPVTWRWEINNKVVEFTTEQLTTQRLFLRNVLDITNARPRPIKPRDWEKLLDEAIATARIEEPPEDATNEGQLLFHLNKFCTGRAPARALDELLLGKPYFDPETGRNCFVLADLLAYLTQQRVSQLSEKTVYTKLMDRGLQVHASLLKGKLVTYWSLPPLEKQTENFEIPKPVDDDVPF